MEVHWYLIDHISPFKVNTQVFIIFFVCFSLGAAIRNCFLQSLVISSLICGLQVCNDFKSDPKIVQTPVKKSDPDK